MNTKKRFAEHSQEPRENPMLETVRALRAHIEAQESAITALSARIVELEKALSEADTIHTTERGFPVRVVSPAQPGPGSIEIPIYDAPQLEEAPTRPLSVAEGKVSVAIENSVIAIPNSLQDPLPVRAVDPLEPKFRPAPVGEPKKPKSEE